MVPVTKRIAVTGRGGGASVKAVSRVQLACSQMLVVTPKIAAGIEWEGGNFLVCVFR